MLRNGNFKFLVLTNEIDSMEISFAPFAAFPEKPRGNKGNRLGFLVPAKIKRPTDTGRRAGRPSLLNGSGADENETVHCTARYRRECDRGVSLYSARAVIT